MSNTYSRHCRTCGFAHTQLDEGCPRWPASNCPVCERPNVIDGAWITTHTDLRTGTRSICPASGQASDDGGE